MILSLLLAWTLAQAPAQVPAPAPGPRDISSLAESFRAQNDVPALCIGAVRAGELVSLGASGVRKRGSETRVTVDDKFHLGSCTKAMTATLAALLVEEGKLRWDSGLFEVSPELREGADPGWKDETLSVLLQNRGGLPAELDQDNLWQKLWDSKAEPRAQRRLLLEGVLAHPPLSAPGSTFLYANANFAVAGAMLETAAGKPWEELMVEKLFGPLSMPSAGFGPPGSASALDQPRGHDADGNPVGLTGTADNPAAIAPAGRVHCSLRDWARFVALHLAGARAARGFEGARKPSLLSKEAFERMHVSPEGTDRGYAMGWSLAQRPWGGSVMMHSGSNTLWYCVVWIAPEKDFAAMACCNQGGKRAEKACDAAIGAMIGQVLGGPPKVVPKYPPPVNRRVRRRSALSGWRGGCRGAAPVRRR